ncbi:MAG TPA: hypothetical protein PLM06_13555 [Anaerolineae bacterium]|nr:hypothetical protein [Anaerolineae bacterium]
MSTRAFFGKGWFTRLAFSVGRHLPPAVGEQVARLGARVLVSFDSDLRAAVFDNQRHVLGPEASPEAVRANAYEVFRQAARAYYELFRNVGRGRTRVAEFEPPVRVLPETRARLQAAADTGRGVFIAGCHVSNFDLGGIAFCQEMPVPLQVLALANPTPGMELFNRLRQQAGIMLTPISPETLRQAIRRLREGEGVITGVDRPIGEGDAPVEFFGATAHLPVGYMRMVLRANCVVMTGTCFYEEGEYHAVVNPHWEPVQTGDREHDVAVNLRRVLTELEGLIRQHPEQWMMFVPVWR